MKMVSRLVLFCACLGLMALPLISAESAPLPDFKGDAKAIMSACADRAVAIKPKDAELLAEAGRVYLVAGNRARAEEVFQAAVTVAPKKGKVAKLIGEAWLKNGFKAEALESFKRMETLEPKDKNLLASAAVVLLDGGEDAMAVQLMERAWNRDPQDWQNTMDFARAALRNRKLDLAAIWFERTVAAAPKDETMWNEVAKVYADRAARVPYAH